MPRETACPLLIREAFYLSRFRSDMRPPE